MSLYDFKAWLRTQPDKEYNWNDPRSCLMAQYLGERMSGEPPEWYMPVTAEQPWTVGAALKRAEELV